MHHKAIGIAGMVLIIGSTTYMLLGRHLDELDPSSMSPGFLSGSASSAVPSSSRAVST